jgi:uncharacterized protein YbaR (Trm112 family)
MLSPDQLESLRCPMDPARQARLAAGDDHLRCERCGLRFRIRDGFPSLVIQDAELPEGCPDRAHLPCQQEAATTRSPS